MNIEFAKLSGSGNDFICLDNRSGRYDALLADRGRAAVFARTLCRRGLGVGADGVIFACPPEIEEAADISARFFEPDGSEAELCGNGTACFVHWLIAKQFLPDREIRILAPAGVVLGRHSDGHYVRVCIPLPRDIRTAQTLEVKGRRWDYDFAVTGVPHAILYVDDLDGLDIAQWGPAFRHHPHFAPRGVNANFVRVLGEGELALRTWEFGVEGETLACGTGASAAAILAAMRFRWSAPYTHCDKPVWIHARSGDTLRVYLTIEHDGRVSELCLETVVRYLYDGVVSPELARQAMQ